MAAQMGNQWNELINEIKEWAAFGKELKQVEFAVSNYQ
jgi:hypothetical protein